MDDYSRLQWALAQQFGASASGKNVGYGVGVASGRGSTGLSPPVPPSGHVAMGSQGPDMNTMMMAGYYFSNFAQTQQPQSPMSGGMNGGFPVGGNGAPLGYFGQVQMQGNGIVQPVGNYQVLQQFGSSSIPVSPVSSLQGHQDANHFGNVVYWTTVPILNAPGTSPSATPQINAKRSHDQFMDSSRSQAHMSNQSVAASSQHSATDADNSGSGTDTSSKSRKAKERQPTVTRIKRRRKARSGGSSQYRGVSYHARDQRYTARLWNSYTGKTEHLGSFREELAAAKAVDDRVLELYGTDDPEIFLNLKPTTAQQQNE